MINRDLYINKLVKWKDKKLIKVLTGMRRVGKSTLLLMYKNFLIKNGVDEKNIIYFNLEDLKYDYISDYKKLYDEIIKQLDENNMNYIMIDEIQNIDEFEKAINSLYIKDNVDIYLTGSNAKFLSSEIATILTGRYIEINVLPLSFKEYLSSIREDSKYTSLSDDDLFQNYLLYGAMPFVRTLDDKKDDIENYLDSIYNTVFAKDILKRIEIRNSELIDRLSKFMFDNIANVTSVNKIANALCSAGIKISVPTVTTYLDTLCSAYLFYKIKRYDIKGKMLLKTQYKYYAVDVGLRNYVLGIANGDLGRILENIVYLELLRREYKVYIGKMGDTEIDFVAEKAGIKKYYQVASSVIDENTFSREIRPLEMIKDNYEKYVISYDKMPVTDSDGIKVINVIDFLLEK